MSEDTGLSIWPTIYDGIAWSDMGDIAIATSEHVELLIPKVRLDHDQQDQVWDKLHLRVNAFDQTHVDVEDPIAWNSSSLGEEISVCEVVGLDWSPQGPAKHKRCALAVHTQNLVLSIWAPTTQPASLLSWKRHIVINRELQRYFIHRYPEEAFEPPDAKSDQLKRLQRVRAFAWSQTAVLARPVDHLKHTTSAVCNEILLAVSNDNNQVIIFRMPSTLGMPTSPTDANSDKMKVLGHFSILPGDFRLPDLTWTFEEHMQYQSFVSKLAWSGWYSVKNGPLMAVIVCATRRKLIFRRLLITMKPSGINLQLSGSSSEIQLPTPWPPSGILRWMESDSHEPNLKVVACAGGDIMLCEINAMGGDAEVLATYSREEWDPVADSLVIDIVPDDLRQKAKFWLKWCVITDPTSNGNSLFFGSHSSMTSSSTVQLDPHSLKPLDNQDPDWKMLMVRRNDDFGKEHRLGNRTVVKLWGMAMSSVKDLMAILITVHPSSQPEYLIQSDYRTTLSVVSTDSKLNPTKFVKKLLRDNLSSETIAFSLKFWLKHQADTPDKRKLVIHEMMNALDQEIEQMEHEPVPNEQPTTSLNTLLYHSRTLKAHRLKRLISLFDSSLDSATSASLDMAIVAKLTTTILRLPRKSWKQSTISEYIILEYKKAASMLPAAFKHQLEDLDLNHAEDKEQCEICEAEIPLESFTEAHCIEGHEFARCSLTFLAIQAPGISKYCGICGKQYIEGFYLETDLSRGRARMPATQNGEDISMRDDTATITPSSRDQDVATDKDSHTDTDLPTLAQLIFAACDSCFYCGGYSHSPASTPNLVEAPPDRVQSMHLSMKYHTTQDESDPTMQTLDLLDEDETSSSEIELEPEMGAQKTTAVISGIHKTPKKSLKKRRSFLGGTTPAAYVSQCFNDTNNGSKKSSKDVSPSSVYSRPQTLQQQQQQLPQTKYEIVAHNSHRSTSVLRPALPIHAPSPLSQSFHPPSTITADPTIRNTRTIPETTNSIRTAGSHHITNSYRLTPASSRWPARKESLPSMLINTQSFIRYSNEHAPTPPPLQLQGLAKRRCSPPLLAPIDVKKSFKWGDCSTFGITRNTAVKGSVGVDGDGDSGVGDKIVIVRLKRREGSLREVGREWRRIVIPAPSTSHGLSEYPASNSKTNFTTEREEEGRRGMEGGIRQGQNYTTWDFDDKLFFEELNHVYADLLGPYRLFSARSLKAIKHNCPTETDSDSFSEKKLMKCFKKPGRGKGKYGWVQWIHRISSPPTKLQKEDAVPQSPSPPPSPTAPHNKETTLTLHLAFSPRRILLSLTLITATSLLISLLWILLGTRTESNGVRISLNDAGFPEAKWAIPSEAVGWRHAGERVAGGLLAGILSLMVGWTGLVGWVFVSWLVE
ncbi:hypothetical protein E2P81_ATG12144 [Venturia nashicola]|nr:hypothetical protein E2P81_ATG12144 [Venturia nashicola]